MAIRERCSCEDKDVDVVQDKLDYISAELKQIKIILSRHMTGMVSSKDTEVHLSTIATNVKGIQNCARLVSSRWQALH